MGILAPPVSPVTATSRSVYGDVPQRVRSLSPPTVLVHRCASETFRPFDLRERHGPSITSTTGRHINTLIIHRDGHTPTSHQPWRPARVSAVQFRISVDRVKYGRCIFRWPTHFSTTTMIGEYSTHSPGDPLD